MPWALGRDHDDVKIAARLNQLKMHIEAVCECDSRIFFQVGLDFFSVQCRLQFIWHQYHDQISALYGFSDFRNLEACVFSLGPRTGVFAAQTYDDVFDAGIAKVIGMGMALRTVTYDDYLHLLNNG